MKYKLLKYFLVLGIMCMAYSSICAETINLVYDGQKHHYSSKTINLYIDGKQIQTTVMPPIQIEGNTLVPVKEVFNHTGAEVEWRALEKSVYIHNEDTLIVLTINSPEAWVNGEIRTLNMPPKLINDKVMIPLRFISESLGYTVQWESATSSVQIITNAISNDKVDSLLSENETNNDSLTDVNPTIPTENEYDMGNGYEISGTDTILLSGIPELKMDQITYEENVHTKQINVQFNGDYSSMLKAGSFVVQEGSISKIEVNHYQVGTQMTITTRSICELDVREQDGYVALKVMKPSEKYSKIVVIDAGHGAHDAGASYAGIREKDLNLSIAQALIARLEADPDIKVYAIREDDTFLELMERVDFSNEINPDLFISIHINSVDGNTSASGTETYYTKKEDTRNLTFATMVQNALINEFGTRNRGVKSNTFVVTRYTTAPAILIEIGFITNDADRAMMTSDGFEERYANAVYQCILDYYAQGLNE